MFPFCLCPNFLTSLIVTLLLFLLGTSFDVCPQDFNFRDGCDDTVRSVFILKDYFYGLRFLNDGMSCPAGAYGETLGLAGSEGSIQTKALGCMWKRKRETKEYLENG